MERFRAQLQPVPHGGLYVIVPLATAAAAGLAHGARVRGTVDGVPYRSSLAKYSGVFHLGVHKATATAAGVAKGDRVQVAIEADDAPLPTDRTPPDLARALASAPKAADSWSRLAPAVRRGFVKGVLEAKKAQTRADRIGRIVRTLEQGVPARRTWKPKTPAR